MTGNQHPRVVVVGSINMDVVTETDRHPAIGETVLGRSLSYFPGGKGANQAVAAARAGARVAMVASVGTDHSGTTMVEFLASNNIDISAIRMSHEAPTGTAIIVVDKAGRNSIVVIAGANAELSVDPEALQMRSGDVVIAQFETPLSVTSAVFAQAREAGATCILNAAPAAALSDDVLQQVDILIVNEIELQMVSGADITDEGTTDDVVMCYELLRSRGFGGRLVATLGARGSYCLGADCVVESPGRPVAVVDTTGAGDCFVGYLASGVARGDGLADALRAANLAASVCVQRPGAGTSMPYRADLDALRISEQASSVTGTPVGDPGTEPP